MYTRLDLPKSYVLEDWETVDDIWIKRDGQFYNVNEFCTVGAPIIPASHGGAQTAMGDFAIAAHGGEIYPVMGD
tara:strand:+ start:424 stop:645 length:222 start_codon:yes stop_codon:yes gene_type:complete